VGVCAACGRENPEGFQFCGFCSAPLTAVAAPTARERKVVSVLFCDLVGFTAASETADPEEVQARVGPYHQRVRREIEGCGGTVEKFIGDAVMAVFGAPVAHEDDAERAVRAGLRVLEAIEELNEATPDLGLSVRVGINTGEAVVSLDARPDQGEAMVTGDVVNTAARIQSAAPVAGVAVGEGTFRATERVFNYEPLEAVAAKGKVEPVALWRALGRRARYGSDVIRLLTTPLVGRELDLQQTTELRAASDRDHAGPRPPACACLPRAQTERRQEPTRSAPLPETTARPHRLHHAQERVSLDIGATLAHPSVLPPGPVPHRATGQSAGHR
jgi:class 3 adenylate cyclase